MKQQRKLLKFAILLLLGLGITVGCRTVIRDSIPVLQSKPPWWTSGQDRTPYILRSRRDNGYNYEEAYFPTNDYAQAQMLREFAVAARLYRFDPTISYYRSNTTSLDRVGLETPTHSALFVRGVLRTVESFYDSSDTDNKAQVVKQWYQCTGTWSEAAAIKETRDILRRLEKTNTLADVLAGWHEYKAEEVIVRQPDGKKVKVTPFPVVRMFHKDGALRVRVEFRMGTDGPAGVTCWYCLSPD